MKITLKQLDQGFKSLSLLAETAFEKDKHKICYKISRIYGSAKRELEEMHLSLADLAAKHGLTPGVDPRFQDPEKVGQYQLSERLFLRDTWVEVWGDPFHYSEIADFITTPMGLANLDWMIVGGPEGS